MPDTHLLLGILAGFQIVLGLVLVVARFRPSVLPNFLLLALSLGSAVAGGEFLLRRFAPQIPESRQLFQPDRRWGWQFVAGASDVVVFPGDYQGRVTINADGFRDRDYSRAKEPGRKRVLVLGDSFTAGIDVDGTEVYTEVMEDAHFQGVDVLNFGVNGFGPTQEMLLLEGRGFDYAPDIVVMTLYVRNDFEDLSGEFDWGRGYIRPRAVLGDSAAIHIVEPPALVETDTAHRSRSTLPSLSRSHLLTLARRRLSASNDEDRMPPEIRLCRTPPSDPLLTETLPVLRAVLRRAASECAERDVRFAVAIAPSIVQVDPESFWTQILRDYALDPADFDLNQPNRLIRELCAAEGIPCLDLEPALRAASSPEAPTYHVRDQHWNSRGHALVAAELARFLVSLGWFEAENLVAGRL